MTKLAFGKAIEAPDEWRDRGANHGYPVEYDGVKVGRVYRVFEGSRADGWWIPELLPHERFDTRKQAAQVQAEESCRAHGIRYNEGGQ